MIKAKTKEEIELLSAILREMHLVRGNIRNREHFNGAGEMVEVVSSFLPIEMQTTEQIIKNAQRIAEKYKQ